MLGIVLMAFGLLAVADVFSHGLTLSLYGKDQTTAADLAQQEIEFLKMQATSSQSCPPTPVAQTTTAGLNCLVGGYATTVASASFDPNGTLLGKASGAYFTRDAQVQYWAWDSTKSQFVLPSNPYVQPTGGTPYLYHVSMATHWLVRGQTVFISGRTSLPNGCVVNDVAQAVGTGCVQVSTFIAPTS